MKHIRWHIGCSGFYYPAWRGQFYPAGLSQKKWFEFYAQHFSTLEINNTFYRFPEKKLFDNWYQKAPPGFVFSVKVPQVITHRQRFRQTESLLNEFYSVAYDGLKEKLGPLLFQLPPSMVYDESLLHGIIKQTNPLFRNVVEFRHNSWWRKDVLAALAQAQVIFCGVSYPGLINSAVADLPTTYYRFHGVPKLYYSAYPENTMEQVAQQLTAAEANEAFVYFNNTAAGAAIENAKYLQCLVATG